MPRTRSFLFDGSVGRAFFNTQSTSSATNANLVAGPVSRLLTIKSTTTALSARNIGNGTPIGSNGGLVNKIQITLAKGFLAPSSVSLRVNLKRGTTYANSTLLDTYYVDPNTTSVTFPVSITVSANQFLYADISYSATPTRYASGLTLNFTFFPSPA